MNGTGGERGIAFSPDGSWLAATGGDGTLKVFGVNRDGTSSQVQAWHLGDDILAPVFSPDGRQIIVLGESRIYPVQVRPWRVLAPIVVSGSGQPRVSFTADGRLLLVIDGQGIQKFDRVGWHEVLPAIHGSFSSVGLSPDGSMVRTSTSIAQTNRRGSATLVQIWSLATGAELAWQQNTTGDGRVGRAPEGGPAELRTEARRWRSVDEPPTAVGGWDIEFSDRTVDLKEDARDRRVARFEHDAGIAAAVISPQARWVATSSMNGVLRLWPLDPKLVLDQACALLPRNLTEEEWKDYSVGGTYRQICPTQP
jgi:WD40 repeat protein